MSLTIVWNWLAPGLPEAGLASSSGWPIHERAGADRRGPGGAPEGARRNRGRGRVLGGWPDLRSAPRRTRRLGLLRGRRRDLYRQGADGVAGPAARRRRRRALIERALRAAA